VLLPSAVWLTAANAIIFAIWRLNGKEPWYPVKTSAPEAAA
jgi:translocator protein